MYTLKRNRNALSVAIDVKTEKGLAIVKELVKVSDVVLENYRYGVLANSGLGYQVLKAINPSLVYTSVSGFGHKDILPSPYADRPAYDNLAQALSGLMSVNGQPGGPPLKVGIGIGDIVPGIFAVVGTLAALRVAQLTGEGQHVDISLIDSMVAVMENPIRHYTNMGYIRGPSGNLKHVAVAPYSTYACKDGYVVISAGSDKLWANLCRALGREEWSADPRFATNKGRVQNNEEWITPWLVGWTGEHTKAEIESILSQYDVPVAPVLNCKEVTEHPHIQARDMLIKVAHPVIGEESLVNTPIKMSKSKTGVETPAPTLGQHTAEVLSRLLGFNQEVMEDLQKEGVLSF